MSWLNEEAPANISNISTTLEVSQKVISELNEVLPLKSSYISVTLEVQTQVNSSSLYAFVLKLALSTTS